MVTLRKSTTFVLSENDIENPKDISQTIPGMAMPLSELLRRHTRGLEVPTFNPLYNDEEIPDLRKMDLTEQAEYKANNQAYIDALQAELKQAQFTQQQIATQPAAPVSSEQPLAAGSTVVLNP